jgi:hypothetical protein
MAGAGRRWRAVGRLVTTVAIGMTLLLASSAVVEAALVGGALPASPLTYVSTTQNAVNMAGEIRLKIKDNVTVKTTYSIVAPGSGFVAPFHYHHGPVIVTLTAGTLTFYDTACRAWDVTAGETYIEQTWEIAAVKALPEKNAGATVEWFTTRLYPNGTADPVVVDAPCTP